jgi:hypothetical protein
VQLDQVTLAHVRDVASAEGRPQREALRILVGEAVAARRRNGNAVTNPVQQVRIDEADEIAGRLVATYLPGRMRYALAELATKEQRSLSSMAKFLIREGLFNRGMFQPRGNDQR